MIEHSEHKRLGVIRLSAELARTMLEDPRRTDYIDGEALFHKFILPEEYKYVRCDALPLIDGFAIYITHPDLPEIEHEKDATRLEPVYQRNNETNTVTLLEVRRA